MNIIVDLSSWQLAAGCTMPLLSVLRTQSARLGHCFAAADRATPLLELSMAAGLLTPPSALQGNGAGCTMLLSDEGAAAVAGEVGA